MNIAILNGPNLNLLGKREPDVYGNKDFDQYFGELQSLFPDINLTYFQSNSEGSSSMSFSVWALTLMELF